MSLASRTPPATDAATPVAAPDAGFLFDPNRCTGCAACSLACSTENGLGWGVSWRQIVSFNPERRPGVPAFHLSLACNHCDDAPCVAQCPTRAIRRDLATGAVTLDEARCVGCRYCAWVCPYDAPRFDAGRGVMTKCTLCSHRLAEGRAPACVEACPTAALGHGPLAGEARLPGFPDAPARPRIRFTALRRGATPPETTWSLPPEVLAAFGPEAGGAREASAVRGAGARSPDGRTAGPARVVLSFRDEWPLWLFTSGLAGLVGWIGAAAAGPLTTAPVPVPLLPFVLVVALLLALSTLHLGRPLRAWRTLANVGVSALSREILSLGAFVAVSVLWLAWGRAGAAPLVPGAPPRAWLGALGVGAGLLGLATLAAVDRIYRQVKEGPELHSAETLLTGPLVAATLMGSWWLFGAFASVKLAAAARTRGRRPGGPDPGVAGDPTPVALRAAALAGTFAWWAVAPRAWAAWALVLVALVELVDRARFYRQLGIPGPWQAVERELRGWITGGSGCSRCC